MRKSDTLKVVLAIVGCTAFCSAMGKKPRYQERTVYAPPVRRGSAANPNPAFAPPNFNSDSFAPPAPAAAPAPGTPPTYNYGYDKTPPARSTATLPVPATPVPAPAPKPPAAAAEDTEQTLPGLNASDSAAPTPPPAQTTPAIPATPAAPDSLAPGSTDVHPAAK